MKIVLSGYGKMGRELEKMAPLLNHQIVAIIDNDDDFSRHSESLKNADIAIDFSMPETAFNNILRFWNINIPVVVGTTGWYDQIEELKTRCSKSNKTVLIAPNFSIGMNIVFALNSKMAQIFNTLPQYNLRIEETHHTQKKDTPSGTAISLANDIVRNSTTKSSWINGYSSNPEQIEIISHRQDNVFGIHSVIYTSEFDQIELKHTAQNRKGFAYGALQASEWLIGKTGFFTLNDMLNL